eukprot:835000-Amphidinium_carterae.1
MTVQPSFHRKAYRIQSKYTVYAMPSLALYYIRLIIVPPPSSIGSSGGQSASASTPREGVAALDLSSHAEHCCCPSKTMAA